MRPPGIPSLERGETHQITPWNFAQRGRQDNQYTPVSRLRKKRNKTIQAKRRPKLGEKRQIGQLILVQALGQDSRQPAQTKTATEITCKNFDNKLGPEKKNLFRCKTHNINNIPEIGRTMKSKEITAMATGRDGADIRMWQELDYTGQKLKKANDGVKY